MFEKKVLIYDHVKFATPVKQNYANQFGPADLWVPKQAANIDWWHYLVFEVVLPPDGMIK